MKQLLSLTLLLLSFHLNAQFHDDFSDGDFTNNPAWTGDTNDFIVNSDGLLQLFDEDVSSNVSQLFTAYNIENNTTWEFLVRQDFSASGSNFSEVYLSADVNDLTGGVEGYLVKMGGISGGDDAIELIKQTGETREVLISGTIGAAATDLLLTRIKVERDQAGNWILWADYTGERNYQQQGTSTDNDFPTGNFFGFVTHYTASRFDKMFFDEIFIDTIFTDNSPPEIISVETTGQSRLNVLLSENLTQSTANAVVNYSISGGLNITNAQLNPSNNALVRLTLNENMTSGETYTLTINQVTDLDDNAINNASIEFDYFFFEAAESFDLIINEFMADPLTQEGDTLGLPNAEFVEIYNRSDKTINLEGIELESGSNPQMLPNFILTPNSFVIICDDEDEANFAVLGTTISVPSFPALSNDGDEIILTSPEGVIIDAIEYNKNWYQNSSKSDGAWTLERIRPNFPCDASANNWRASENGNGGTPGQINSIVENQLDEQSPDFQRAFPINSTQIRLYFDESMNENSILDVANYQIEGLNVSQAELETPFLKTIKLTLDSPIAANTIYTLIIKNEVEDCIGNEIGVFNTARFALPEVLETEDIVLNEILFAPESGGTEFIELYNRSSKNLNIGELIIANRDDEGDFNVTKPLPFDYLLFPDEYVVLTENTLYLKDRYLEDVADQSIQIARTFLEMDLPSLGNDEGDVVIYRANLLNEIIIDEFAYNDDFHYPLLDDTKGVSLERIDPNGQTQGADNWHSASAKVFFGTPGYQNSQFYTNTIDPTNAAIFDIPNRTFSPDNDGFEDFLLINYLNDKQGYTANIRVFDANGRLVRDLVKNELLAIEGSLKWDGSTDTQTKARIGIYVLWIELFHPDGDVLHFKESVVVAAQF